MKKWLLVLISFGLIGFVLFKYILKKYPCEPPEKPLNIPKTAVWKGDCDGGSWIKLVSIKEDKVRFKIYRDWNGDLLLDADFEYISCDNFKLTQFNWADNVAYFGKDIVIYNNPSINIKCRLTLKQAYEGELKKLYLKK